jgi:HEAT repeat protein
MRTSAAIAALLLFTAAALGQRQPPPPQPEAALLEIVRSDAPLDRKAEAFRQLGQVGTARAVPVLAGLLADEQLAHWARIALEQIPDPSVPEALRAALPKLKGRLLAGALISLGARPSAARGENSDTALFARYLRDADPEVASAAAHALGRHGTRDAAKLIEQALPTSPEAVKPILWDAALRVAATLAARGSRKEAAQMYDRLRTSSAPAHVRLGAARGAVLARGTAGIPLLTTMLQDADRGLFNVALELAHVVPGAEATRAVAEQLPKLPAERRALVIQALAHRGHKAALPAIRAAAREGDPTVRLAAVKAIAQLQDTASLPLLLDAAVLKDEAIAAAAMVAIVSLPGSVDEALIRRIGGSDQARSLVAIESLSRRQSRGARPVLLKVAGDGEAPVRIAALKALAAIASDADVESLIALLGKARSAAEIEAAEEVLTAVCTRTADADGCARRLAGSLPAAQPQQKRALLRILEAVGGPAALQAVRSSLKDPDAEVRDTAVRALGNWSTPDAAPDLIALARSSENPIHKLLALRGFIRLAADESLPAERRLAMAAEARTLISRDEERRQWLGVLGAIPSPAALLMVAPLIGEPAVNEEACRAAVEVARKLLTASAAARAELKSHLPAIAETLQKAAERTRDTGLATEIKTLQAKVRELQGR